MKSVAELAGSSTAPEHTAPTGVTALPSAGAWVLKLLTGPRAGGEVSVVTGAEYVFGRGKEADVVLAEDLVSRRHALLSCTSDEPSLSDLGSTNGTFVNGERVTRAKLRSGDRLLIGTTIARFVAVKDVALHTHEASSLVPPPRPHQGSTMAGRLDEVPPVDLLQLFSNSRKSGRLLVRASNGTEGEVVLASGRVAAARLSGKPELTHRKALMRLLRVTSGAFEFVPTGTDTTTEVPTELQEPTELLLMDALRLGDELSVVEPELPPSGTRLHLASPLPGRLRSLEPDALDLLQLAWEHGQFTAVIDRSSLDDVVAVRGLLRLLSLGYLKVVS